MKKRKDILVRLERHEPSFYQYLDIQCRAGTLYKILEIEDYCVDEALAKTEELARARDKRQAAMWRQQERAKARRINKKMEEYHHRQEAQSARRQKHRRVAREKAMAEKEGLKNLPPPEDQSSQPDLVEDQSSPVNLGESQSNRFDFGEVAGRIMNGIRKELDHHRPKSPGVSGAPGVGGLFNGVGAGIPKVLP